MLVLSIRLAQRDERRAGRQRPDHGEEVEPTSESQGVHGSVVRRSRPAVRQRPVKRASAPVKEATRPSSAARTPAYNDRHARHRLHRRSPWGSSGWWPSSWPPATASSGPTRRAAPSRAASRPMRRSPSSGRWHRDVRQHRRARGRGAGDRLPGRRARRPGEVLRCPVPPGSSSLPWSRSSRSARACWARTSPGSSATTRRPTAIASS